MRRSVTMQIQAEVACSENTPKLDYINVDFEIIPGRFPR